MIQVLSEDINKKVDEFQSYSDLKQNDTKCEYQLGKEI